VSVAATHRRRGIGRQLMEAELRTAAALQAPVAILTVSEATIYSRYGFAPAAFVADWVVETVRTTWSGQAVPGRIQFARLEQLAPEARKLIERTRLDCPGDIQAIGHLWERVGVYDRQESAAKDLRCVRFDDASGRLQGYAVYRFEHSSGTLEVEYLHAATPDAYSGLWRFLLEVDLVSEVRAPLRSVDESFVWQLSDRRAARKSNERDHLWLRILDLRAALEARRYPVPGRLALEVDDPLGFAAGRVLLDVRPDGAATLTPLDGAVPDGVAAVALGVNELAAIYLGGVSAVTLARAGRITEFTESAAQAADRMFRSAVAPWLSIRF
jgi:predicted acetyltransferase